jgi:protein-arginine kinase activator protein McsA
MEIKCGFNDEDEEDVAEILHTKNLKEAAHVDKITKEAWAKVMVQRKITALTASLPP